MFCNVNEIVNCTNVLSAPQSAVFGFPNSMMSLVLFVIFFSIGLVGISDGKVSKGMLKIILVLSLFTLGFGSWFLWQSTFVIGSICLYCIANFFGLIIINVGLLRINYFESNNNRSKNSIFDNIIANNYDYFLWGLYSLVVLTTIYIKLGL